MNQTHAIAGWIRGFVGLLVEVEAGVRPVRHIRPMLTPALQARVGNAGRAGTIPKVGRVLLQTSAAVCEAVVLVHVDDRTTAVMVTLGRDRQGWLITGLGRPEDRPADDPPEHDEGTPDDLLAQMAWHREPVESRSPTWTMPAGWIGTSPPRYDTAA